MTFRKAILRAVAGTAMILAGVALAKPGGGGGPRGGMGMSAVPASPRGTTMRPMVVSPRIAVKNTAQARLRSQARVRASASGVAHANSRSVLKGGVVVGGSLAGLTKGMVVRDVNGNTIGTVKAINTASGGRVVNVLVKSSTSARTIPLSPATVSVSGGVATTTSLRRHTK
jgi:hypothetical protein